jgi:hypothetical protein
VLHASQEGNFVDEPRVIPSILQVNPDSCSPFNHFTYLTYLSPLDLDLQMDIDAPPPLEKGKVLLYTSRDKGSEPMSTTVDVGQELQPVLRNLSTLYSPIRSKFILLYIYLFYLLIFCWRNGF